VTIRVSEELKNAMNDVALFEDRRSSEVWRIAAELYLYGHHRRYLVACSKADSCQTVRDI
jgi:predicted transcriptional regulator